jgi:hypothetical protein
MERLKARFSGNDSSETSGITMWTMLVKRAERKVKAKNTLRLFVTQSPSLYGQFESH